MRYSTVALTLLALTACGSRVEVDSGDTSPPGITVTVWEPREVNALFLDGSMVGTPLSTRSEQPRPFTVDPEEDDKKVYLLITAEDRDSGISSVYAEVKFSFRCRYTTRGGGFGDYDDFEFTYTPDLPRSKTWSAQSVILGFSLEDLWKEGCEVRQNGGTAPAGRLERVQATLAVRARNNSISSVDSERRSTVDGTFSFADADVNLTF